MKRGLFRLWVLVSTCWVLVVGTIGVSRVAAEMCVIGPNGAPCNIFDQFDEGNRGIELSGNHTLIIRDATVLFWLGMTFLPVAGLFVFGRGVLWVVDGFRG
jgi:hypothetical protein